MNAKSSDKEQDELTGYAPNLTQILALPTLWRGQNAEYILGTLSDVLLRMFHLTFARGLIKASTDFSASEWRSRQLPATPNPDCGLTLCFRLPANGSRAP